MAAKKGSRGDFVPFRLPLAGSRGGAPLWGLGQRPNCFSCAQLKGNSQQRRRQRSVPASNFALPQKRPQAALFNVYAMSRRWRDRTACLSDMAACFRKQGFRACGRESVALRAPPTPLRSAHPCGLTFIAAVVCTSADAIMPCRNGFADV